MYILNRQSYRKRRRLAVLAAVLLVAGLGGAGWVGLQYIKPETTIGPTPEAKVTRVLGTEKASKQFQAGPANLSLPDDWEAFEPTDLPAGAYSWRNTKGNKGVRVISLYIDNIPRQLAVNRVLVVQSSGNQMVTVGGVSDNCSEFNSQGRTPDKGTGQTPARWQNVAFLCDSANYSRNVVGTGSTDGVNSVRLDGAGGSHEVFLMYNDADATPRFDIFTAAVESLRLR